MRTLVILLALVCAGSNALLLGDWVSRGELLLSIFAAVLLVLALVCAGLAHRLRN